MDVVGIAVLALAPTLVAVVDMFRFRSATWRRAGERRGAWLLSALVAPWLGPGLYATGPRLRLALAVREMREEAWAPLLPQRRELRIVEADGDLLDDWVRLQSAPVEPPERHRLTLAYVDDVLVGHGDVRPPTQDDATAAVTVRILPEHRGHGWGAAYADVETAVAHGFGPADVAVTVEDDD